MSSSDTPSLNFYRKWLHDVGGIEQEAGEALMARIDELESALDFARQQLADAPTDMAAVWDEGYDAGAGGEYHDLGSNPYRAEAGL